MQDLHQTRRAHNDAAAGYAFDMDSPPVPRPIAATDASALTPPQLVELVNIQPRVGMNSRHEIEKIAPAFRHMDCPKAPPHPRTS